MFLDAIETASSDPRVKVLLARVGDDELGLAKIQELRDAIAAFRAKGKFALAFADSFGEFGPGTRPYYLATAFDEIWLQPMGNVGLTGLYAEVAVLQGHPRPSRDRPGIRPSRRIQDRDEQSDRNQDDPAASRGGRRAARLDRGTDRPWDRRRAANCRRPRCATRSIAARLLAEEARQAKLVDRLGYRDEVIGAGPRTRRVRRRAHRLDDLSRPRRPAASRRRDDRADLRLGPDRSAPQARPIR